MSSPVYLSYIILQVTGSTLRECQKALHVYVFNRDQVRGFSLCIDTWFQVSFIPVGAETVDIHFRFNCFLQEPLFLPRHFLPLALLLGKSKVYSGMNWRSIIIGRTDNVAPCRHGDTWTERGRDWPCCHCVALLAAAARIPCYRSVSLGVNHQTTGGSLDALEF